MYSSVVIAIGGRVLETTTSRFGGHVTSLTLQHLWPRPPGVWLGGPGCKLVVIAVLPHQTPLRLIPVMALYSFIFHPKCKIKSCFLIEWRECHIQITPNNTSALLAFLRLDDKLKRCNKTLILMQNVKNNGFQLSNTHDVLKSSMPLSNNYHEFHTKQFCPWKSIPRPLHHAHFNVINAQSRHDISTVNGVQNVTYKTNILSQSRSAFDDFVIHVRTKYETNTHYQVNMFSLASLHL